MHRPAASAPPLLALLFAPLAHADVVTLVSSRDNTLYESTLGNTSNGAGNGIFAGVTDGGFLRRGLLRFNLGAAVPAGSRITAAALTLHMSRTNTGSELMTLHRVLADWGEGTSVGIGQGGNGANATPGDATWLHTFYPDSFWAHPGGDYTSDAAATTLVAGVGFYTWSSTDSPGLVADVQDWAEHPALNFGWMLLGDEAFYTTAKRFDSREHLNPSLRPMLRIEFTPAPAPAAVPLLWTAALGRLRRRRNPAVRRARSP